MNTNPRIFFQGDRQTLARRPQGSVGFQGDRQILPGRPQASVGYQSAAGRSSNVILSGAKDLSLGRAQILRSAQDDSRAEVHAYGVAPTIHELPMSCRIAM